MVCVDTRGDGGRFGVLMEAKCGETFGLERSLGVICESLLAVCSSWQEQDLRAAHDKSRVSLATRGQNCKA